MTARPLDSVWKSHRTAAADKGWSEPDCEGALRVVERPPSGPMIVECDVCEWRCGVGKPTGRASSPAPAQEDLAPDGEPYAKF